ncbi:zinc-binding dehydrogenase [Phanerochaete sordida]|uniref:Zinc-binding dehydrogenase n=1 Tax=Phanerochaete sordida TaxID=48140 RepID=A0A9P3G3T5_9APHY|nr:zinc-binding dehydrogenase [Phanerochaete sordida]
MSPVTSKTMVACRWVSSKPNPVFETVPIPVPAADEVLIKVLAAGVCHSDLGMLTAGENINMWLSATHTTPFTIGHEGAGIICELGASAASASPIALTEGDYVAIWCGVHCQIPSCQSCPRGYTNLCSFGGLRGVKTDGTWAEYITIHASCVVPVPSGPERIPPAVVSAATDAVLTPWHAMKTLCGVSPAHTVLCMGIGGLGLNGVGIAKRCLRARCVVACDTRAGALEDARAAGADHAAPPAELPALLAGQGLAVDFAFDFVGVQATFDACCGAVRPGGTVHVVGLGADTLAYRPLALMAKDLTVRTSFWGTRAELAEVLQAVADGLLRPKAAVRPMSQCVEVLDDMRAGRLLARTALVPDGVLVAERQDVSPHL